MNNLTPIQKQKIDKKINDILWGSTGLAYDIREMNICETAQEKREWKQMICDKYNNLIADNINDLYKIISKITNEQKQEIQNMFQKEINEFRKEYKNIVG